MTHASSSSGDLHARSRVRAIFTGRAISSLEHALASKIIKTGIGPTAFALRALLDI